MLPANMSHSNVSRAPNHSMNSSIGNSYHMGQPQSGPLFEMDTPVTPISLHHRSSHGGRDSLDSAPYTHDSGSTPFSHSQGGQYTPAHGDSSSNRYNMDAMTGISSIGGNSVGPSGTAIKSSMSNQPGNRSNGRNSNVPMDTLQGVGQDAPQSRGTTGKTEVARRVSFGPDVHQTPQRSDDAGFGSWDSNDEELLSTSNNRSDGNVNGCAQSSHGSSIGSDENVSSTESSSNAYPHKLQRTNDHQDGQGEAGTGGDTSTLSTQDYIDQTTMHASNSDLTALDASRYLSSLLTLMMYTQELLSKYRCRECIHYLHKLPKHQFSSAWVQHTLGKFPTTPIGPLSLSSFILVLIRMLIITNHHY